MQIVKCCYFKQLFKPLNKMRLPARVDVSPDFCFVSSISQASMPYFQNIFNFFNLLLSMYLLAIMVR